MNKNKIFLLTLTFITLQCEERENPLPEKSQNIEFLKKFAFEVLQEMQRQPDAIVSGVTLGDLAHALSLRNYTEASIAHLTNSTPIENQQVASRSVTPASRHVSLQSTDALRILRNQNSYIDLLERAHNALLAKKIKTYTTPTLLQSVPHLALTAGTLAYNNYKDSLFPSSNDAHTQDPAVYYTATGANILIGFGSAYIALSLINSMIKP